MIGINPRIILFTKAGEKMLMCVAENKPFLFMFPGNTYFDFYGICFPVSSVGK